MLPTYSSDIGLVYTLRKEPKTVKHQKIQMVQSANGRYLFEKCPPSLAIGKMQINTTLHFTSPHSELFLSRNIQHQTLVRMQEPL